MTQIILHNAFSFYQEGFLKSFNQFIEYRHARFFLNEKMKLSKWEDKDMTKEIMNAMNTQIFGSVAWRGTQICRLGHAQRRVTGG